jgi:hypothetical protein
MKGEENCISALYFFPSADKQEIFERQTLILFKKLLHRPRSCITSGYVGPIVRCFSSLLILCTARVPQLISFVLKVLGNYLAWNERDGSMRRERERERDYRLLTYFITHVPCSS